MAVYFTAKMPQIRRHELHAVKVNYNMQVVQFTAVIRNVSRYAQLYV